MTMRSSRACAAVVALFGFVAAAPQAGAQSSDQPVTIVVPFTPGTGPDVLARTPADELHKKWQQPFVIDNKPGANGVIGAQIVARAVPDGQTLLMTATSFTSNYSVLKSVPYDPVKNFEPVIQIGTGHLALAVHPSVPVKTTSEFIAYAKTKPGALNYASAGTGGPHHLAMELFKQSTGVDLQHVPYKGTSGAVTDLLAGHVDAGFVAIHVMLPSRDKIRMLGAAAKERAEIVPDLPTLDEQGVSGFDVSLWYGLFAPAGTPSKTIARYNTAINEILADPRIAERLKGQGLAVVGGPPERLGDKTKNELDTWRKVVRRAGIKAQ